MYDPPNFTASPLKCSFISALASLTVALAGCRCELLQLPADGDEGT